MQWVAGADPVVNARLDLPDGAQVTKVDFFGIDNNAGQLSFSFTSFSPDGGFSQSHASSSSSGTSAAIRTFTATPPSPVTISNDQRAYELSATTSAASSTLLFSGARVFFTLP